MSISDKFQVMAQVTREEGPRELLSRLAKIFYSTSQVYVLRKDLKAPLVPRPEAKIPITVRPLQPSDMAQIEVEHPTGLLTGFLRAGLPQCYVALTKDQEICFLQWLITPENREKIRSIRFRRMHGFDDDTVMMEYSYTFKRFRGLGIMALAVAMVAEEEKRARWAVTYVDRTNIPALRGCRAAGFVPYLVTTDKWRLFHLSESAAVPDGLESFWYPKNGT